MQIKQTEVQELPYYLSVFYIHVYTAMIVLVSGSFQFSRYLRQRHKILHRTLGYVYVLLILCFAAPTGLVMGLHANGGLTAQVLFVLLSILWWYYTLLALLSAKDGKYTAHKEFMMRSFALTLSALTLRIWKVILAKAFHLAPMDIYVIIAGLGWVPNLLLAEYLIFKSKKHSSLSLNPPIL